MNYKNTSTSEHAWLFASYRDRWQGVIDRGSFGVGKHYAFLKEVQPGDPCVAYVYGEEVFTGWGRVTGGYYRDEIEKYRHRVKLEMKLVKNDVPLHSIRGRLQFVKNVPNLGRALQKGGIRNTRLRLSTHYGVPPILVPFTMRVRFCSFVACCFTDRSNSFETAS